MKYSPEIDGLRAVAILPVLLFHVGAAWIPGGFTGVDVFFVISGFLITSIIVREAETNSFSLADFYKRRALRILPALSVVLIASILGSQAFLYVDQFEDFGEALTHTSIFAANIHFWSSTGYFDPAAEESPLLHMWSLAVEEQFYVIFPLLVMALARFGRKALFAAVALFAAGSLAVSIGTAHSHPYAGFYLLPSRFWEMAAGAMLAIAAPSAIQNKNIRLIPALLGLWAISFGMFALTPDVPFPGWAAIFPVLGASLLIAFAPGTVVGRILATRPMVWIGKISFSLYLWHWPLIVFYRAEFGHDLDMIDAALIIAASFAAAGVTYFFVETPFRSKKLRGASSLRVLPAFGCALALFAGTGWLIGNYAADIKAMEEEDRYIASFLEYPKRPDFRKNIRRHICFVKNNPPDKFETFDREECLKKDDAKPNYLLIGDSHAAHLWKGLKEEFSEINLMQMNVSGCQPNSVVRKRFKPCDDMLNYLKDEYLPGAELDGVIIVGRWRAKYTKQLHDYLVDLKDYVDEILVLGPVAEYDDDLPRLLLDRKFEGDTTQADKAIVRSKKDVSKNIANFAVREGFSFVSQYDILCPKEECIHILPDGSPVIFDYGHLTLEGARFVAAGVRSHWNPLPGEK